MPEPLADLLRRFADAAATDSDVGDLICAARDGRLAPVYRRHAGGRPAFDDSAALSELAGHVVEGASVERAALLVARAMPGHSIDATARRLARKFRAATKSAQN